MARKIVSSRTYKNPEAARRAVLKARRAGAVVEASEAAEKLLGIRSQEPAQPEAPPIPSTETAVEDAIEVMQDRLGDQAEYPYWKDPTNTEFPHRPRSDRASYDPITQILNIEWARPGRLGPSTNYYDVTPQEWDQVQHTPSTGKYVNRVLNYKRYDYP